MDGAKTDEEGPASGLLEPALFGCGDDRDDKDMLRLPVPAPAPLPGVLDPFGVEGPCLEESEEVGVPFPSVAAF